MRWATRGGLVEHMASVHEGKTYDCELCDATFKSKGGLRGHHTTVHDTTNAFRQGLPYRCTKHSADFSF